MELRLAAQGDPQLGPRIGELAAAWAPDYAGAARAIPDGAAGAAILLYLCEKLARTRDRVECGRALVARSPLDPGTHEVAGRVLTEALFDSASEGPCANAREACRREILGHAEALEQRAETRASGALLRAELLLRSSRPEEADDLLKTRCEDALDRLPCLRLRFRAALASGSAEREAEAARALTLMACPDDCGQTHGWIADQLAAQERWRDALSHARQAASQEPTAERWEQVASVAKRAGSHAVAVEALEHLARMRGESAHLRRQIDSEKANAARQMLPLDPLGAPSTAPRP
jgi:hypothetical protein